MENLNKKSLIICNPNSGKGVSKEILDKYRKILQENGYCVDVVATEYSNHAAEAVASAINYDIIFSVGGDGTLNEVIKGNYQREDKLRICPLPYGTCNDVATMLGYGKNPINNLKMALDGEFHNVDIGTINDNPFIYVVGMGKFMNIPYETSGVEKRKSGYIAYLKGAFSELVSKMKRYNAEITIDGQRVDGSYSLIMVSNSNHIAGINNFYRGIHLDDGEMEILLCRAKNKREFIKSFLMFFLGQCSSEIVSLKGKNVSIKLLDLPDKNWCVDGEEYDYIGTEYNIRVQNNTMEFLVPKSRVRKLFRGKKI